jgi:hypothetical protein
MGAVKDFYEAYIAFCEANGEPEKSDSGRKVTK